MCECCLSARHSDRTKAGVASNYSALTSACPHWSSLCWPGTGYWCPHHRWWPCPSCPWCCRAQGHWQPRLWGSGDWRPGSSLPYFHPMSDTLFLKRVFLVLNWIKRICRLKNWRDRKLTANWKLIECQSQIEVILGCSQLCNIVRLNLQSKS